MASPKTITFFILEGFQSLDLFGPLEAYAAAHELSGCAYRWQVASFNEEPVKTESGIEVLPTVSVQNVMAPGTVIFVGGFGPRTIALSEAQCNQLISLCVSSNRIASICTGSFLAAALGVLDSKSVATHWRHADEMTSRFPSVNVDPDRLFIKDGAVWSSAGVTAGIDMALAMITEDYGLTVSASVARQLVVYLRRKGNQAQFSEPLIAQSYQTGRLSHVMTWIVDNLNTEINVRVLAREAGMSQRNFSRVFRERLGISPAQYVEHMRLDKARTLLDSDVSSIHHVASAVGFSNSDSFRRAFERRFAISPKSYRARFGNIGV